MADTSKRKTALILALATSLVVALAAIIFDDDLREYLGVRYYIISLSMIGCVLLILAGYVWDRTLQQRLKELRTVLPSDATSDRAPTDHDEIIGLARNIERMAQALQHSEASYRGIVEDQIDLICRYRPDGTLTFANRAYAEAVGRRSNELVGQPFILLAPPTTAEGGPALHECEVQFANGERRWLLWTVRAIRDRENRLLEYQAVGHDISVRKEAEAAMLRAKEAAEAADRAKGDFLAMVSQEIRLPINGVLGTAQTLSESPLNPQQREHLAVIKSSAQALEKLINDIVDLSKMDAGQFEVASAPFALHRCIEEVTALYVPKARAAALTLTSTVAGDVPTMINGDEAHLRQVLSNLIGNALKFTERGGISLRVSCARGESQEGDPKKRPLRVFFSVTDTGIGIPPEKQAHLFKPFSQIDSSDRRRAGTGLGLIISKRLCELMGGTISVESHPGKGTTLHFSILAEYERGRTFSPFPGEPVASRVAHA